MARGGEEFRLERADLEALAVLEQVVELRAVAGEAALGVVDLGEGVLDGGDPRADPDPPAERVAQVRGSREVVGMHVGLEDPVEPELRRADVPGRSRPRGAVAVRPESMSKSSTLSMTAQARAAGSATT